MKVPEWERDRIPILTDRSGVLASGGALGYRTRARAGVLAGDRAGVERMAIESKISMEEDVSNNDNGDNKGPDPRIPRFNFNNRMALISLLILVSFFVFFFVYNDRSGTSELRTRLSDLPRRGTDRPGQDRRQYEIQGTFKAKSVT